MGRENKKSAGKHSVSEPNKSQSRTKKELPKRRIAEEEPKPRTSRYGYQKKEEVKEEGKEQILNADIEAAKEILDNNDDLDSIFNEKIIGMPNNDDTQENKKDKKRKKKKMSKPLKIVLTVLVAILIVIVSIFGSYMYKSGGSVTEAIKSMVKDVVGDQDPIFVLVLGVSEDISAELTDTIMLVGYNPDNNQGFVLSIPRDTFVGKNENTAGGFDKINALYQKDPQRTVTAVENLTGIKIDHYITVKTSVLVNIVDTLGGVEFDVPINMDYDDTSQDLHIHLKAGPQKLNGDQAEQLVRFRHNNNGSTYSPAYGDNDEGRMRTQREFLKTVATQVIQTRNIDQIKQVLGTIFDNLVTNITLNKAIGYVPYAMDIKLDELQMDQLPGGFAKLNSLWFYKADSTKTKALIDSYIDKLGLTENEKKKYLIPKKDTSTSTKSDSKNTKTENKNSTKNESSNTTNTTKNTTNTTEKNNNTSSKNTTKNETKNTTTNSTSNTTKNSNTTKDNKNTTSENSSGNSTGNSSENKPSETTNTNSNSSTENETSNKTKNDTANSQSGSASTDSTSSSENSAGN